LSVNLILRLIEGAVFSLTSSFVAVLISFVLYVIKIYNEKNFLGYGRRYRAWEFLIELVTRGFESVPIVLVFIILSAIFEITSSGPLGRYYLLALLIGVFAYPRIWRIMQNALEEEERKVYPLQMIKWNVKSYVLGIKYILPKMSKKIIIATLCIAVYVFTLDITMIFILNKLSSNITNEWLGTNLIEPEEINYAVFIIILALISLMNIAINRMMAGEKEKMAKTEFGDSGNEDIEIDIGFSEKIRNLHVKMNISSKPKGNIIWLKGESGSGKSLIWKTVLGVANQKLVNFSSIKGVKKECIDIMFQEPSLYLYPFEKTGKFTKINDDRQKIMEKKPYQLNAGAKRIVARNIFLKMTEMERGNSKIKLLVLDEPDTSLDFIEQKKLLEMLKDVLSKNDKIPLVVISHNKLFIKKIWKIADSLERKFIIYKITGEESPEMVKITGNDEVKKEFVDIYGDIEDTVVERNDGNSILSVPKDIYFEFSNRTLIRPLLEKNLEVQKNSMVFLLGPNGVGKSLIARAISGLMEYKSKSGKIVNSLKEKGIIYIYDDIERALPENVSLREIINDISKSNMYAGDIDEYMRNLEKKLKTADLNSKKITQLSGGQRQKLILSLLFDIIAKNEGKLVILDETLSRLDWEYIQLYSDELINNVKKHTFIMISHNPYFISLLKPVIVRVGSKEDNDEMMRAFKYFISEKEV